MTIGEVKRGLICCSERKCTTCPYRTTKKYCIETLQRDAEATIGLMEAKIKELWKGGKANEHSGDQETVH